MAHSNEATMTSHFGANPAPFTHTQVSSLEKRCHTLQTPQNCEQAQQCNSRVDDTSLPRNNNEQLQDQVFAGVIAADCTLEDLSMFLKQSYGNNQHNLVVLIPEANEPEHYLISVSTGTSPHRRVPARDNSESCVDAEVQGCVMVRAPATHIVSDLQPTDSLGFVASKAAQAQ